MDLIGKREKNKFRKFLAEALEPIDKALNTLYPSRAHVIKDGRDRLNLLYVPFEKVSSETGNRVGRDYPVPHGDTGKEWLYLQGELEGWNWKSFGASNKFPVRSPPFPAEYWPTSKPRPSRTFPIIETRIRRLSTESLTRAICAASWILFIGEIPREIWTEIILILLYHDLRLRGLAEVHRAFKECEAIRSGILSRDKGLAYLGSLQLYLQRISVPDEYDLPEAIGRLRAGLEDNVHFDKNHVHKLVRKEQATMEKMWKDLKGPSKKFHKEVSRYIRPLVIDLFDYLYRELQNIRERDEDTLLDLQPLPCWIRPNLAKCDQGLDAEQPVNRAEIYSIIFDLTRFFYRYEDYRSFGLGFTLPDWRGTIMWKGAPRSKYRTLVKAGREGREHFTERIRQMHLKTVRRKPDRRTSGQ